MRRATSVKWQFKRYIIISIHALLAESDGVPMFYNNRCQDFYPRSPCGERHSFRVFYWLKVTISIHALLAESDARVLASSQAKLQFLSTLSLRRATLGLPAGQPSTPGFLSTLSLRRATRAEHHANSQQEFLSTLSLRRATTAFCMDCQKSTYFYPRSPCGERPPLIFSVQPRKTISIHALLAESDAAGRFLLS